MLLEQMTICFSKKKIALLWIIYFLLAMSKLKFYFSHTGSEMYWLQWLCVIDMEMTKD